MELHEIALLLSLIAVGLSAWSVLVLRSGVAEIEAIARDAMRRNGEYRYHDATKRSRS